MSNPGVRVAQLGPWSTTRDWNLRATQAGELRLPFRFHVRQGQDNDSLTQGELKKFSLLPAELRIHIVSYCDTATLFQLMHTSHSTRQIAQKMFWSDPTTRYIINGEWLLAGGHVRHTNYDLEALAHLQYIEVSFNEFMTNYMAEWKEKDYGSETPEGEEQRAVFWAALRRLFPRVKDIVINEYDSTSVENDMPNKPVQLANASPIDAVISISQLRYDGAWWLPETRHLWQRDDDNSTTPTWDLVESAWRPRRITPPTRQYSGPVGKYQKYELDDLSLVSLGYARDLHAMHTTAAYYTQIARSPCVCLWPHCGQLFERPEDWMAHYLERCLLRYDHEGTVPLPPDDTIRAEFLRHDNMLAQKRHELTAVKLEMQAAWGEPDSAERSQATEQFLQQLRDDPVYAGEEAPEYNELWYRYKGTMNGDMDGDTHIYTSSV